MIGSSRLAPIRRWLCKSNARWMDLLQAGRDRNATCRQSGARVTAPQYRVRIDGVEFLATIDV